MKLIGDLLRDFALDGKHIGDLAVVVFGPEVGVPAGTNQLSGDTDAIARTLRAAFDHVSDPQLVGDVAHIAIDPSPVMRR